VKAVLAIASIALRSGVRSRLFLFLAVWLLVTVIGLPLTLKGDGTPEGRCRVLVVYTLGFSTAILGIATLWLGGAAVSREIEDKHIRLIAVKPVHAVQIWLGKWIGLLALNGVLLAAAGLAVALQLQGALRSEAFSDADRERLRRDVLVGRRVWSPSKASAGPAVPAGGSVTWTFPDDPSARRGEPRDLLLRFHLRAIYRGHGGASGIWSVHHGDGSAWFTHAMEDHAEGVYRLEVPECPPGAGLDQPITVTFRHTGDPQTAAPIVFDPREPVALLVRETGFVMNLARAVTVLFGLLALLAAVGITIGTLFSFPVAVFVTAAGLLVSAIAQYAAVPGAIAPAEPDAPPPSLFQKAGAGLQRGLRCLTAPAMRLSPLSDLSDGLLISGRETARAFGVLFVLYPGVLAALGAAALRRKELAR
jgi:hypothetical protein